MFQFSDDFDDEAVDFLNIPLDDTSNENDKNSSNRDENLNTVNRHGDSSTKKSDPMFDDFDDEDDEMMLSVVENVDSCFNDSAQTSILGESSILHDRERRNRASPNEPNALTPMRRKTVQERIESFVCSKSALTPKHKLVTTTNESSPKSLKLEYERKFPGPAGLILKKSRDSLTNEELNNSGFKQQLNMSITEDTLTSNRNWQKLMEEVTAKSCEQSKIMNEFTVVAMKRNLKQISRKVPLFAAVISDVDSTASDPSVRLKDPTGEIRGMLQRDLWEQYSHLLVVGSALLLRRVSMLSLGSTKGLYLNITTNNVDTIYSNQPGNEAVLVTRVTTFAALTSLYEKSQTTTKISGASNHSMISTRDKDVSLNSTGRTSPSIDNELEGIDVDSLLEDF